VVERARDAEDDDDDWDDLPRRRQQQWQHRRRVAAVAIGAGADFTQLDGGTDWDRHNGGDHVGDVWNDVSVRFVVAGDRAEVVGMLFPSVRTFLSRFFAR
jgi:phage-related tail fiber protein